MCGIAGFLSRDLGDLELQQMTDSLTHRGPDAFGYFLDAEAGFGMGHRRLSILDLSQAANQPFRSVCGRYSMVYNGEVYNFMEIAGKLKLNMRTTSDTEVIIEGFARKGPDIFRELNGMFALAIWDHHAARLTLARDRLGIKPLYVGRSGNSFMFASEIKAFTRVKKYPVNRDAVAHFLYLGYVPQAQSLLEGIGKFPAGCHGTYTPDGSEDIGSFWKAESALREDLADFKTEGQAVSALEELLTSSVRYRMISDVPLGTFLSGGTDSSTVTAFAQEISDDPVKTFSIGFRESKFNEADYARRVAEHLGTEHHEFILSQSEALELFDSILTVYDEPFADSSSIPTLLVSEMARRHVTVALSGDGGDELFMGYGTYRWADRLGKPGVRMGRKLIAAALSRGGNRYKRAAHLFRWNDPDRIKSHIFSQEQYYFTENELRDLLLAGIDPAIRIDESDPGGRKLTPREAQSFFDIRNYLKDDLLLKVDRASMRHSLEVRVPLLDHRIVEFALRLPQHWKVRGGVEKYLLKQVLYKRVPKQLFQREKWGFGIPLHQWLRTDLKYLVDRFINPETLEACGLVRPEGAMRLKRRFFAGEDYLYNRLWSLLLLHKWYGQVAN